jgi:hypothetical protein
LSTLTKVLIVLLTVFSIFLCGIVVTYVANADNYRQTADDYRGRYDRARATERQALDDLEEQKAEAEGQRAELAKQINQLGIQITDLNAQIDTIKRENTQLVQKLADMAAVVETANAAAQQQTQLFEKAQQQVEQLTAEQTRRTRELQETDLRLMEQMALVVQLQAQNRDLTQENQELETRLSQLLQQYGRGVAPTTRVTPVPAIAKPAEAPTRPLDLAGTITAVDMTNGLAQISIGTAAGIKQNMKLHVTRGDEFVCDLLIVDADPDKAVGELRLVQAQPKVGDRVTTNL